MFATGNKTVGEVWEMNISERLQLVIKDNATPPSKNLNERQQGWMPMKSQREKSASCERRDGRFIYAAEWK